MIIRVQADNMPFEIVQSYEKNGAACLSILTDEKHFQGSFENLETVWNAGVKCPLLCKEFVIDIWQIYYARSKGVDAFLLIAAVLPDLDIKYMLRICKNLGMTALIEVHDERELDHVLKIDDVELIGINNRSLETFKVDTSNTKILLEKRGDIIRDKEILVGLPYRFATATPPCPPTSACLCRQCRFHPMPARHRRRRVAHISVFAPVSVADSTSLHAAESVYAAVLAFFMDVSQLAGMERNLAGCYPLDVLMVFCNERSV